MKNKMAPVCQGLTKQVWTMGNDAADNVGIQMLSWNKVGGTSHRYVGTPFGMDVLITCFSFLIFLGMPGFLMGSTMEKQTPQGDSVKVLEQYVAIDNVCAWPNLTYTPDGDVIATIFNQPSHGRSFGDVDCWTTKDGRLWTKTGTPAPHEPGFNRMNVAAGLTNSGELIVLASGWEVSGDPEKNESLSLVKVLRPWVSISSNMGKDWTIHKAGFPKAEDDMTDFIPFGDVLKADDGSLRVIAYAQSLDKTINKVSMCRSDDNGRTWTVMSKISTGSGESALAKGHNETAIFNLGNGEWIAAARRWRGGQSMDLFRSMDDGKTWSIESELTESRQHPGHITLLQDGRLLLTYGNRISGQYGVAIRTSKDKGKTWSPEQKLFSQAISADIGYPSSVQYPDGKILTAFYSSRVKNHDRYHMGTILWEFQ